MEINASNSARTNGTRRLLAAATVVVLAALSTVPAEAWRPGPRRPAARPPHNPHRHPHPPPSATTHAVVSDTHGTMAHRDYAPSVAEDSGRYAAYLQAPAGRAVAAPDYLGLGKGPGLHP